MKTHQPIKCLLLAVAAMFCFANLAYADMTDDQVIAYAKQAAASGKSKKQIGVELLSQGVTQAQIDRIRSRVEAQESSDNSVDTRQAAAVSNASNETDVTVIEEVKEEVIDRTGSKQIFGHNLFRTRSLSFEPNENLATPQNYVLGPGDEVIIDIWGNNESHMRKVISREGSIMVDQLGPIYLNGLTIQQANKNIRSSFANIFSDIEGEQTNMTISLGTVRTIQVNVLGEVDTPGTFRLSPFATVFNALYHAGGINQLGSLRNVQVMRNGRKVATVDIYEYLLKGDLKGNIRLQEGDVIVVPTYQVLVNASGNFKRPMYYEMKPGESLEDLIRFASGFSSDAFKEQVRITRQTGTQNEFLNVAEANFKSTQLRDGDDVAVGSILDRYTNRVEIQGAVMRPGMFAISDKLKTVKQLIQQAEGLSEDAFQNRALIFRETDDLRVEVIPFDVRSLMDGTEADIALKRNDIVQIPSILDLYQQGPVTINGMVNNPGEYPYSENVTLEDMIVMAGGLQTGASLARVDVSRRIIDPNTLEPTQQIAETITLSIKDGLVMNGDRGFQLRPYDLIEVRKSPAYMAQRRVTVNGEVLFEGGYSLQNKNERLTDLIKRAGGLTEDAYVRGAHLMRRMTEAEVLARNEVIRLAQRSEDKDSISVEKLNLEPTYSVGINLEEAMAKPGSEVDLVLQDGDVLVIPELINTVKISGDVLYPNTVVYRKGMKYKDYVNQAGGFGSRADKRKAFVVYLNGSVAKAKGNTPIEPGCTIIVPSKPDKGGFDLAKILPYVTTLTSLGTMTAAIASILK